MICDACEKSLSVFSMLVGIWSVANDWNDGEDMKDDFKNFEMFKIKQESTNDLSNNSIEKSCNNAKTDHNKEAAVNVKSEPPHCSDDITPLSEAIQKQNDTDVDMNLKNEEISIKEEDG